MELSPLHIARYACFGLLLVFSLIVLGISANLTNISRTIDRFVFAFEGLSVAASVLTFFTVIPVLVIDFLRRGAYTSLVVVELAWVFVLMILWTAAAGRTSDTPLFVGGCSDFGDAEESNCHQFQALQAFSWLNFVILLGWLIALSVSAAITHNRGQTSVWTSSVSDTRFFTKGSSSQPAVMGSPSSGYPPQQYTPQTMQGYPSPTHTKQQSFPGTPPTQPSYYQQPVAQV